MCIKVSGRLSYMEMQNYNIYHKNISQLMIKINEIQTVPVT